MKFILSLLAVFKVQGFAHAVNPLHEIARDGKIAELQQVLNTFDFDINELNERGRTLLMEAALSHRDALEKVKSVLLKNPDVSKKGFLQNDEGRRFEMSIIGFLATNIRQFKETQRAYVGKADSFSIYEGLQRSIDKFTNILKAIKEWASSTGAELSQEDKAILNALN